MRGTGPVTVNGVAAYAYYNVGDTGLIRLRLSVDEYDRLGLPANVRLHFLPPCTPELQPVEPFWALVREAVANDTFDRLADLRRVVRRRCRRLAGDRADRQGGHRVPLGRHLGS